VIALGVLMGYLSGSCLDNTISQSALVSITGITLR